MTAKLVKGENLTPKQIQEVKSAFGYRWTIQNENRARNWQHNNVPTVALIDDEQYIKEHAFYFRKDGKLASVPRHCVPVYLAE